MRALSTRRPPLAAGVALACTLIALETLALYPLGEVAPPVSLGVVYLVGVLVVSIVWGARLGVATSFVSAAAFNFFHIPPTGRFTIVDAENWVALVVFLITAVAAAGVAEAARLRAQEAEQRKREADLSAELARVLLGAPDLPGALGPAAQRIAQALELPSARIVLDSVGSGDRTAAVPLTRGDEPLGTLLVPRDAQAAAEALRPALETLLAAALEREALTRRVAGASVFGNTVETVLEERPCRVVIESRPPERRLSSR